ncbi:unnamed protein product [Bursaphelenchus okinawaensis]|uniref:Glycine-rich protein n=1 Tax=Bursaphelenchus okinawaensis TaxID=465554 RepID=A0A811L2K8_9BILA|nr:unnamed protein product [Bursaphelenchus okinawaensis]CAG9117521.1 unnamed protein product [Bursaphelenchus okinawaensis]
MRTVYWILLIFVLVLAVAYTNAEVTSNDLADARQHNVVKRAAHGGKKHGKKGKGKGKKHHKNGKGKKKGKGKKNGGR